MTITMKKIKKGIAMMAVFLMLFTIIPMNANAMETASDISGHWAEETIQEWIDNDWVKGYLDGSFKPDDYITRAEFVALVNRSFQFTATGSTSFTDVNQNAWYASAVGIAVRAGYIQGYNDNTMRPENHISREEAATIIMKINNLSANSTAANVFTDSGLLTWSRGAVGAVAAVNLMTGYPDGTFGPDRMIRRGETVVLLDRSVKYIDEMDAPAAPDVTRDDVTNTVTGMTSAMEYRLDDGMWTAYVASEFNALNLSGNHTLLVRYAAMGILPSGMITTLTFTTTSSGGGGSTYVSVTGVSVMPEEMQLIAGGPTGTITATVAPSNATNKNVSWTSSDMLVATVSSNGVVTPLMAGTTTITATTANGPFSDSSVVTVITPTAALAAAIAAEDLLTPADYVDYTAVTAALALLEVTDAEKIIKTVAIYDAIDALVFAGQANLNAAKAEAAVLVEADYTAASWLVLTDALALPETTNAEVVAKTTAIDEAIAALVFAGQAALDIAKAEVIGLVEADYTIASWILFTDAMVTANVLPETTNIEVITKTLAIDNAIAELVLTPEAALTAAKTAESLLIPAHYVDYSAVTTALLLAEGTDVEMIAKTTAIYNAIAALELTPEATLLAAAKAESAVLVEADYTAASWLVLTDALALPETTNAEVVAKTTAIDGAIAALVFDGQAALNAAEAEAAVLVEADYTAASWLVLTEALALPETTNEEVVIKTDAINQAIDTLLMKITPVVDTAIEATAVTVGETLADSTLSGSFKVSEVDATEVPGTLAWDAPTTVVNATGNFEWTFTPTDTTIYNVVTGTVSVTAN